MSAGAGARWSRFRLGALYALYALYLAALLAVALLLAEFVILPSRFSPVPRDIQLSGFHAPPSLLIDGLPTNDLGFMGDVVEVTKPPGELRILTLGGSALFDRGMTQRLAQSLGAATERPLEVTGAALRHHTTMSSVLKYGALAKYQFDYVLIYHGINGLWANNVEADAFREDYSHLNPWYVRGPFLDRSLLARWFHNAFLYDVEPSYYNPSLEPKGIDNGTNFASVRTFRRNVTTLIEAIRAAGGEPVLMTFAWSIPDHYSYEAFQAGKVGYHNPDHYDECAVELWGSPAHVAEGLRRHNDVISELAVEHDTLLIDQESLIGRDLEWFGDPVHLSEAGTARFVEIITERFVAQGLLK